ncbi:hypothetical protein [Paraflavitalea pollutisoli]|uniref:hypothetical protein n=1 Tax=Paraflavitalea pollutisoli TaxID=3034143 RepID=UPI0023EAB9F0|nr:hypothetical protein [Paraflavitalea sp. H1-2-19X]
MGKGEIKLITALKKVGFRTTGIYDLFNRKTLPSEAVQVILQLFPEVYKDHRGHGGDLLRSLIAAEEPFDPAPLIEFFEDGYFNKVVMWTVGHVIAVSKTTDISNWLKHQLLKEYATFERASLVQALPLKGGFRNSKELIVVLKKIYDKYPIEVLELLKKHGTIDDIAFLQEKLKPVMRPEAKDVEKLIARLEKKAVSKKK